MPTLVQNARWIIAWDDASQRHAYLENADLVFHEDRILFIGKNYPGSTSQIIDGRHLMLMPGLVNIHTHPWSEPLNKGFAEDFGNASLGYMAMYDTMPGWVNNQKSWLVAATVAYSELLLTGTTTIVDNSPAYDGWIELVEVSGVRAYLGPAMSSSYWVLENADSFRYEWSDDDGAASFDRAMSIIDTLRDDPTRRVRGIVFPGQVDTCSEAFLRKSVEAAQERNLPLQIHAAQSIPEYREMIRRHGKSPLAWLDDIGVLSSNTIISHCIFLNDHSSIGEPGDDLERLARAGVTVAHCPTVFARTAAKLENFARYVEAGVNVAVGTDTYPHDMFEEMRLAQYLSRTDARKIDGSSTADLFCATTIAGAKALGRSDIGRLSVGSKADILFVDIQHPQMQPARDPLRSMVQSAGSRAIRDVVVDGRFVVLDGQLTTLDYAGALSQLGNMARLNEERIPSVDVIGRSGEDLAPLSLPRLRF
jgi:5-methylthioadenosine/S-adenosylhomocysteine deaminase